MLSTRLMRCGRLLFLTATLVSMAGCGVAGYEAKMKEEKERLAHFDSENSVLGPPMEEPVKDIPAKGSKEKVEDPPGIFFRAPKGIKPEFRRQPKDEGKRDRTFGDLFYIYPRSTSDNPITELLLAVYEDPKNEVSKDLLKQLPSLQGLPSKTRKLEPFGRSPFTLEEKDSGDMLFYFFQKDAYRAALVFRVEKGRLNDVVKDKITTSLRTLAVEPESAKPWNENRAQSLAKNSIQVPAASTQP